MTAHNRILSLILSVLLLVLFLGGCDNTPPAADEPTNTTTSVTATVPSSTQTTLRTTTTANVTTTTAPSGATTTTTTTTAPDNPSAQQWVTGDALTVENATATFSLPAPTIFKNPVAIRHGKILFEDGANNQRVYSLFDPVTETFAPLGEAAGLRYGSAKNTFSTDERYYYTAYLPMTEDTLVLYRVDLTQKAVKLIEKKETGANMSCLYAEGDCLWRIWYDDPDGTHNAASYTQHFDRLNVATGEVAPLFEGTTLEEERVYIADGTIYLLAGTSIKTYTLEGEPLATHDLAFLHDTLGDRMEFSRIRVSGGYVFLDSAYGAHFVVLNITADGLRLVKAMQEEPRISRHYTDDARSTFGYLLTEDNTLLHYDAAADTFTERALPHKPTALFFDEDGRLLVMYRDRAAGKDTYHLFENIAW